MFEKPQPPQGLTMPICTGCDYALTGLLHEEVSRIAETLREIMTIGQVPKGRYRPRIELKQGTSPALTGFEVQSAEPAERIK